MNTSFLLFIIIFLFLLLILITISGFVFLIKRKPENGESVSMLDRRLIDLSRILDDKLSDLPKFMQSHFSESTKIIRDVTNELVKVGEGQKQVVNLADQLKNLQDILKNPKQRGVLGEYFLEETLKNVLSPGSYEMQYKFHNNDIVDAVIFIKDKIIPIDSKFSLENYERLLNENDPVVRESLEKQFKNDLKNRIDETSKYVRPSENTMDFAFMFIPSEAIYYDLLVNKIGTVKTATRDLIEYAFRDKKVIIVSPTSFLAYLQTVLQGLKALQIEESAKEIKKKVEDLGRHLAQYEEYMRKLGNHLNTAINMYDNANKEFVKIDKDILKITGINSSQEVDVIDKNIED